MKYYLLLFLLIIFKNHSICLGITNERKYKDLYMIDVSSDDLPIFIEKLYLFLDKVKFDFYMFLIVFISLFLFSNL
jgi:hypothetical protein